MMNDQHKKSTYSNLIALSVLSLFVSSASIAKQNNKGVSIQKNATNIVTKNNIKRIPKPITKPSIKNNKATDARALVKLYKKLKQKQAERDANKKKQQQQSNQISIIKHNGFGCFFGGDCLDPFSPNRPFKIRVKTDNPGITSDREFEIPTFGDGYNYQVDCNSDGFFEAQRVQGDYTCRYQSPGEYSISISGDFPQISFLQDPDDVFTDDPIADNEKLLEIEQWGDGEWRSMEMAFAGTRNMVSTTTDIPRLRHVENMVGMFYGARSFNNQALNNWDVSNVTDMSWMFDEAIFFNQPLNNWNVGNVTDMSFMFFLARSFNQPLNNWDVSNVTDMLGMFGLANSFNRPLNNWDISNVTDMSYLFGLAESFNQSLNSWDVRNITNMSDMFYGAHSFNQPLDNWNVSNVTDMSNIFDEATDFNQPLDSWDVSNVTDMSDMFYDADSFNQPLYNWDVSNVTNMSKMFDGASSFNQPLNNWDVSNVTKMSEMFDGASSFNQPLNNWDVSNVTNMSYMFNNITLSTENYSNMLISWSSLNLQPDVEFDGGQSQYNALATDARESIINTFGWTITDGGPEETSNPIDFGDLLDIIIDFPIIVSTPEPYTLAALGTSTGGTRQNRTCAANEVITGIRYEQGSYINNIEVICAPVNDDGSLGANDGGSLQIEAACPAGFVLSGITAATGTYVDNINSIDCTQYKGTETQVVVKQIHQDILFGPRLNTRKCNGNDRVNSLSLYRGQWVDRLILSCIAQ